MLVVGLRRAEAAKRINRSRQAGHRRSPRLTNQLPHYPVVNGANYANISTTRRATASLPSLFVHEEGAREVRAFLQ